MMLPEFIHDRMDILFLALNASETSHNGHYFSLDKTFWNLLYKSNLITQKITGPMQGDTLVFGGTSINFRNSVFGLTYFDWPIIETESQPERSIAPPVRRILEILDDHPTKALCLMHRKIAGAFQYEMVIYKHDEYGLAGRYKETNIYEMPYHGSSLRNKHYYYGQLLTELVQK